MAINNVEIIESNLKEILSSKSPDFIRSNLLLLGQNIDNYLLQLENFYNTLGSQISPIENQYQDIGANEITIKYAVFKKLSYNESEIDSLLKQGYLILDKIREFFTNEKIVYEIGLIKGGQLFEFQLTLEQLLKNTKASFNTRSTIDNIFKLRMFGGKTSLLNTYQEAKNIVGSDVNDASTVFSAVYDYVKVQHSHGHKINKGNAYEAYKRIVAERGNQIPPEVSTDLIEQTLTEIRSNTASSLKGGDYLLSQIKFYSAAPSLATTNLIRTSLKEISSILKMTENSKLDQSFKEAINNIFIKNNKQAATKAEQAGRDQALQNLTKLLQSWGFKVI